MSHKLSLVVGLALAVMGLGAQTAGAATDPGFILTATSKDFDRYFPALLANGYVSSLSRPRGTEATQSYVVGLMDYGTDDVSRPAVVPAWSEIDYSAAPTPKGEFWLNRSTLAPQTFQDYSQTLDLRAATLSTRYLFVDGGGRRTRIEATSFTSQAAPHLAATRLTLTPDFDGVVTLRFSTTLWAEHQPRFPLARMTGPEMVDAVAANDLSLEPQAPATADRAAIWYPGYVHVLTASGDTKTLTLRIDGRAEGGLAMAEASAIELPRGLTPLDVTLTQNNARLSLDIRVAVQQGRSYSFTRFVALSREGWGGDGAEDAALAQSARSAGFERLLADHAGAWRRLWRSDIIIEGDPAAQKSVRADLYNLLSASTEDSGWPIGACALTTGYSGHIFWDSDSWIFPALLLLHPERAKSLVDFRARTLAAAQDRARVRGYKGAMYPWEADPQTGTEQIPHFASVLGEREIHVDADIALAQWQYWLATSDRTWLRSHGWPVIRAVADFWASRASRDPATGHWNIDHVASVVESHTDVRNDTFTNLSARRALQIAKEAATVLGERPDPLWTRVAEGLTIPYAAPERHYLSFDPSEPQVSDDWGFGALQMLTLPGLDVAMPDDVRRNDYASAVRRLTTAGRDEGGMGLAPLAIAAAATGDVAGATAWIAAFNNGALKPPFGVRTETPTNNTGYFLTGSGGYLQTILYGLTGLRLGEAGLVQAYAPVLPTGWASLTLEGVAIRGERFDITVRRDAAGRAVLTRRAAKSQGGPTQDD